MSEGRHRYFIINKPYGMLSQFVGEQEDCMLGKLNFNFPEGIHAIGRLDKYSEGLLILTTNKKVTKLLFGSKTSHKRVYLVKVKNEMKPETLQRLKEGVPITVENGATYIAKPFDVEFAQSPANLVEVLENPIPFYLPHTWLQITLAEGKYHQVRKMVKAISHRCVRLIRVSIEDLLLGDLEPGGVQEIEEETFFTKLKIENWRK